MPTPHSEAKPRPPADFAALLDTEVPVLLVGGQAVNLWALYYKDRTSDLAPFVSRDADVLGDQETLAQLGRAIGAKPTFFPMHPPSNEIGFVVARDPSGVPLLVEVLRYVNGVRNEELREPIYEFAVGEKPVTLRVPGPVALLKAKISNIAVIRQTGRQDARHVAILARILPAHLVDLQNAAISGRITERKLLDSIEQLVAIVTDQTAQRILQELKLNSAAFFSELSGERLPKLKGFLDKRLPRLFRG
jgi:hypothetical protein